MLKSRRSRLNTIFESHALDAILFTGLLNIRYLTRFTGSEGALLMARDGRAWFLCDSRYTSQAASQVCDAEIRQFADKTAGCADLIRECRFTAVGFESARMSVADFLALEGALGRDILKPVGGEVDLIRSCKDQDECCRMEQVAGLASQALVEVLPLLRPGIREDDLARELEFEIRRRGAEGKAFDFIVASGERGALPHGRASDKVIRDGELVTIDFGAVLDGYHSDETVTVAVGEPGARAREIHQVVLEAHDRAIAAIRPGVGCREIDAVARGYIADHGYGDYFGHGLGHGIGLDVHEKPVLSPRSDAVLQEGMVCTVEPGIYIPGFGGVRIEDTVIVTANGHRVITQAPKAITISQTG